MNQRRRRVIAAVIATLNASMATLEEVRDEEQDAFDAMPESLQDSENGKTAMTTIQALEAAIGSIDDAINNAEEASE